MKFSYIDVLGVVAITGSRKIEREKRDHALFDFQRTLENPNPKKMFTFHIQPLSNFPGNSSQVFFSCVSLNKAVSSITFGLFVKLLGLLSEKAVNSSCFKPSLTLKAKLM